MANEAMGLAGGAAPMLGQGAAVRRPWCLWLAVGLVLLGAVLNTIYLFNHCPIDLSEDEAHYWEWSRHLDYGYYSKPPGIAWVIWAAARTGHALGLTGDNSGAALMPVVRMPAVLFGLLTGLLSLGLARRIFRDDRAALAVTVLSAAVPMFAVGSLLITIDSPMYLCWAATVYCLWRHVECRMPNAECRIDPATPSFPHSAFHIPRFLWLYAAGFCCAAGMLFKPVLIAIPLCAAVAAYADPRIRRAFKTWHSLGASILILLSQVPVLLWNAQHGWVMFLHIGTQGGFGGEPERGNIVIRTLSHFGMYLGGQAGGMGGVMFVLLVIAVIFAWKMIRAGQTDHWPRTSHIFLLSFALPLWGFYLIMNLWKATEPNWPAACYFTGMILLAGALVEGWHAPQQKQRRDWRRWGTIAVIWGLLLTAAAINLQRLYPLLAQKLAAHTTDGQYFSSLWHPHNWDPSMRLRGMQSRADVVENARHALAQETGQDPLIITNRYDTSSSLAFYLPGQPFVFCIMSSVGGRHSQYDFWPGLNEPAPNGKLRYAGRPAVIIGAYDDAALAVVKQAFDRVEGPQRLPILYEGVILKDLVVYRGYGFRGLPEVRDAPY